MYIKLPQPLTFTCIWRPRFLKISTFWNFELAVKDKLCHCDGLTGQRKEKKKRTGEENIQKFRNMQNIYVGNFSREKNNLIECLATAPRRRESVRHSNNTTRMQNGRLNVSNILEQVSQRILLYFQLYLQSSS